MRIVTCPKCSMTAVQGGFAVWAIVLAILFFPFGLLALLVGRQPTVCSHCHHRWQG